MRVALVALLLNSFSVDAVEAQARPSSLPAMFGSDSAAWERILVYVVSSLSTHLVRTASDTGRQPWRVVVSPEAPREMLETKLRTILRTRQVQDNDTEVYELEIGPLLIANDTGRVRVRTDFAQRCPGTGRSAGYGNVDNVYVVLQPPGLWSIARSEGISHGDRLPC